MLIQLSIRDFAIIEAVDVALGPGMTVLTGETGAGKSILLDALALVLGDRADSGVVREQAARAEISAQFDISAVPAVGEWLREHDLDADGECLLRRVVGNDGRTRSYVNDRPVALQNLRELGEFLVDIHGQHEHQSLRKETVQRELLDGFGALQAPAAATGAAHARWQAAEQELQALQAALGRRDERLDLLRYQVEELRALEPRPGEYQELEERQRVLAHVDRIGAGLQELIDELFDSEASVRDRLARLHARVQELRGYDEGLGGLAELLDAARIHADEAVGEARDRLARLDSDPAALLEVERRLGAIHELARKHRVAPEALPAQLEALAAELQTLEQAGERLRGATAARAAALDGYHEAATALSAARRAAAERLGAAVSEAMQNLGMPGGAFRVVVDSDPAAAPRAAGRDSVCFEVAANPGQSPRPLPKVASGGELSRISLAIQLIVADAARIPTLIFDEVDAGIGGATAEIVGQQLAALGRHYQALCVTHLPQVAAQADHHLQVSKIAGAHTARTRVRELGGPERVSEIARMLGGVELTPQSLAHAQAMVEQSSR